MFDFEKALKGWAAEYRTQKHLTSSTIDELESHLRDSYEHLVERHSSEKAFALAVDKLGQSREIASEFQKIDDLTFLDKLILRGHSLFLFVLLALLACYIIPMSLRFGGALLSAHVIFILLGYGTAFFLGLIGCYGMIRSRSDAISFSHSYRNYCRRYCFLIFSGTFVGFCLGMIWAKQAWGHYFGWDPKEIGAASVALFALCFFAKQRKRTLAIHHLGQMCLILSIVTMIAWFGASGSLTNSDLMMQLLFYGWIVIQLAAISLPYFASTKKTIA